jgi:hypothetical protein
MFNFNDFVKNIPLRTYSDNSDIQGLIDAEKYKCCAKCKMTRVLDINFIEFHGNEIVIVAKFDENCDIVSDMEVILSTNVGESCLINCPGNVHRYENTPIRFSELTVDDQVFVGEYFPCVLAGNSEKYIRIITSIEHFDMILIKEMQVTVKYTQISLNRLLRDRLYDIENNTQIGNCVYANGKFKSNTQIHHANNIVFNNIVCYDGVGFKFPRYYKTISNLEFKLLDDYYQMSSITLRDCDILFHSHNLKKDANSAVKLLDQTEYSGGNNVFKCGPVRRNAVLEREEFNLIYYLHLDVRTNLQDEQVKLLMSHGNGQKDVKSTLFRQFVMMKFQYTL